MHQRHQRGNHQKLKRGMEQTPSPSPEEINPADNCDVGLLAFETVRGYTSIVSPRYVILCYEALEN